MQTSPFRLQMKERVVVDVLAFTERWLPGLREQAAYVEVCRQQKTPLGGSACSGLRSDGG